MNKSLDRIAPFLPWLGLVLLIAGGIAYFITRRFELATNSLLLGGIVVLLAFAILRPDDVRALFDTRQARYGLTTFLSILFFTAIGVILYIVAYNNDNWRIDTTETNEFEPLPETVELLEGLEEEIHIIGFYSISARAQQESARSQLDSFQAFSNEITYEFVDPNSDPLRASKYELADSDRVLVFTRGEGEEEVWSKAETLSDRDIHGALLQVLNPISKKVYFITGHGERRIDDASENGLTEAVAEIERLGFDAETLNLATSQSIPDDADVIALIDQQAPLLDEEITAIKSYLDNGGAAFIIRDVAFLDESRARAEGDGLNGMLVDDWGIFVRNDVIFDPANQYPLNQLPITIFSLDFGTSPITPSDISGFNVLFNLARSIGTTEVAGVNQVELVLTSSDAWGETALEGPFGPDGDEATGPLTIGISAERNSTDSRIVLFGDADFITNGLFYQSGSFLIFDNAMNWLAGDEAILELTPRETITRQAAIPNDQLGVLRAIVCLVGPGLMALIGIGVWAARRRNR